MNIAQSYTLVKKNFTCPMLHQWSNNRSELLLIPCKYINSKMKYAQISLTQVHTMLIVCYANLLRVNYDLCKKKISFLLMFFIKKLVDIKFLSRITWCVLITSHRKYYKKWMVFSIYRFHKFFISSVQTKWGLCEWVD